jgi:hypothetical protein
MCKTHGKNCHRIFRDWFSPSEALAFARIILAQTAHHFGSRMTLACENSGTGCITVLPLGAGPQLRKRLRPQGTNMEVRLTVVFSAARGEQQWKGL